MTKAAQRFDHLEASAQGDYSVAPFGAIRAGKRYGSPQVPAAISQASLRNDFIELRPSWGAPRPTAQAQRGAS